MTLLLGNMSTEVASRDAMENLPSFSLQDCNQSRGAGNHWWAEASPTISTLHSSEEVLAWSEYFLTTYMAQEVYDHSNPGSGSVNRELEEKRRRTHRYSHKYIVEIVFFKAFKAVCNFLRKLVPSCPAPVLGKVFLQAVCLAAVS